jgi:hypothetical protein
MAMSGRAHSRVRENLARIHYFRCEHRMTPPETKACVGATTDWGLRVSVQHLSVKEDQSSAPAVTRPRGTLDKIPAGAPVPLSVSGTFVDK